MPWTDTDGRRHEKTVGRPVSMHAMRGISAHSNGFQTCRTLHLLQILLGSIDCPGGFRYKAPFPRPTPPPNRPARPSEPNTPLKGAPLGFTQGPEDLLVDAGGKPQRIDKAYSWDAPIAAHGLMHMVITNAATADPYPVDVLFMYMANMSWNSSMNIPAVLRHLTATDEKTGEYKIPKIIYSDAYSSEMIAYADLILPDTTYLERWDCISMLDRPISGADAPADAIRRPVVEPDRDVRPFQTVLLDLGARLGLPGFVTDTGSPRYPGGYADYIVNHERSPGIGSLAGFRGADGKSYGRGAPNPKQLEAYIADGCFHEHHLAPEQRYYKHANKAYLDWAKDVGFIGAATPIIFQLYLEPLQKFRQAARGHGAVTAPATHRARIEKYFDPIPFWYPPFDGAPSEGETFSAITQRPMHIYHSWGSHNGWIRQITAENCLYMNRARARKLGIADGDWVWIKSGIGRVKGRVRLMEGVNRRHGVDLERGRPPRRRRRARQRCAGSDTRLPAQSPDHRIAAGARGRLPLLQQRSDHRTGGVVRPARQHREGGARRGRRNLAAVRAAAFAATRRGHAMTSLPETTGKKLGLVIDLDTCVGCQACATSCKEWNAGGYSAPLTDQDAHGSDPHGAWLNRVHSYEVGDGAESRTVHFPRSCLHCETPACVTVCPTGASYKRASDGIVLVNPDTCIGCKLCSWACPYGAREYDYDDGVMKKCTLCVDRIYNETFAPEDRVPACVRACPTGARHFGDLGDPDSAVSQLVKEREGFDLLPEMGFKPVNKYLPPRARRDQARSRRRAPSSSPRQTPARSPIVSSPGPTRPWRVELSPCIPPIRSSSSPRHRAPAMAC